jgi:hypothetical protein
VRVETLSYRGKPCARLVILQALKAAGKAGIELKDLLTMHSQAGMLKALTLGRQAGQWFSHKMPTGETKHAARYWLTREDMEASLQATRERVKEARRLAHAKRMRQARADKRAGIVKPPKPPKLPKPPKVKAEKNPKPVKVAKVKPPKVAKVKKAPKPIVLKADKPKKADPFKVATATNPRNVKPVQLPGCQVERFKPTGEERFFSSLAVGNYLRSESAIARAYA